MTDTVATAVRSPFRIHPTTQTPPPVLLRRADAPAPRFQNFLLNLARPQGIESVHESPNEISCASATLVIEALENVPSSIEVDPPVAMLDGGIAFYAFPTGSMGIKKRLVTVECYNSGSLILIHSDRNTRISTVTEVSSFDIRAISESLSVAGAFLNA